jgi:hypothetical protein
VLSCRAAGPRQLWKQQTASSVPTPYNVDSLSGWLCKHGRALNKLQVVLLLASDRTPLVKVHNQRFFCGLAAATSLTSLTIESGGVYERIVPGLASLQSLQQLELVDPRPNCWLGGEDLYIPKPCVDVLQQLTSLTHLKLGGRFSDDHRPTARWHSVESIQHVWALTQLRSVEIDCSQGDMPLHPYSFQGLLGMTQLSSFSLTSPALCVMSAYQPSDMWPGEEPVPGLTALIQLQVLKLQRTGNDTSKLQPSLLSAFANLQHLVLHFRDVFPFRTGRYDLLTLLPQLQQLTGLEMSMRDCLKSRSLCASLTALTANSRLKLSQLG